MSGARAVALAGLLVLAACRGEPPGRPLSEEGLARLVDSLRPAVEQAAGLAFRGPVRSVLTTREAVQGYLLARIEEEFPEPRRRGVEAAYRLFGLLPDTVDLGQLLLALYTEQVAGYYDPDSSALFAVGAEDRSQLRLVMAHELIHALQHQYLPLDSLLGQKGNGDALAAAQAVLEGQATLASIRVLTPGRDVTAQPGFWETYRGQVAEQQRRMPVFANAPLVLREGLLFPYVAGAAFMRWWSDTRSTPLPAVAELPRSTEQVLHPERLALGDAPVTVRFTDSAPGLLYEDTLGELEAHILLAVLRGADQVAYDLALGWGGDRYRAVTTAAGPALVWVTVWDDGRYANRIAAELEARFTGVVRPGYRAAVDRMEADGRPVVRLVHAPAGWNGWEALPGFRLDANVPPR